jgi:hypothetical protein
MNIPHFLKKKSPRFFFVGLKSVGLVGNHGLVGDSMMAQVKLAVLACIINTKNA